MKKDRLIKKSKIKKQKTLHKIEEMRFLRSSRKLGAGAASFRYVLSRRSRNNEKRL